MSDPRPGDFAAPEELVAALDAGVPAVLLPVRLETRFDDDRRRLRIRVFPDDVHVHTHEPELTEAEVGAGREYWTRRAEEESSEPTDGEDDGFVGAAWRDLVAVLGVHRAEWVARSLQPRPGPDGDPIEPEVPVRPAPWTRPPRVEAMPQRWVAIGLRDGREQFRAWGDTIPADLPFGPRPDPREDDPETTVVEPDARQDDLPIDDGMHWLVDYDEAVRVGMAITVTDEHLTPKGSLGAGLDHLVVVGVDWSRTPDDGARVLSDLLQAHRFTGGLGVVSHGTPTNATGSVPVAVLDGPDDVAAREPGDTPAPGPSTDAGRVAAALGLGDATAFASLPGSTDGLHLEAGYMHDLLWEATWGYFFDHLLDGMVSPRLARELREHFREHVRGDGPLGTLRIDDQPYGVLPVVAAGGWSPTKGEEHLAPVARVLDDARGLWEHASARSPHLGRTTDPDADLLDVLQHTPTMSSLRYRAVVGPLVVANTSGLAGVGRFQRLTARWALEMLGDAGARSRLATCILHPHTRALTVPLVQRDGHLLQPNYLADLAARLKRPGGLPGLDEVEPTSLLHALVLHGARLEVGKAAAGLVRAGGVRLPLAAEPELVDVERGAGTSFTTRRLADKVVPEVSGRRTLADHVVVVADDDTSPATAGFRNFWTALAHLDGVPTSVLTRLLAETLDCSSHRLDAWLTSLATARLATLRRRRATGAHVGGFGWVEDLRPDGPRADDTDGFVHTPSMAHAHTAAILRSAHLAHADDADSPLAVDLSSVRVREALAVLEGMRRGQPLGALLGYRFERSLRERDPALARYVLPFRRVAPLRSDGPDDATSPTVADDAIAARDVVDGVTLLERWREQGQLLLSRVGATRVDRAHLFELLTELEDRLDALADLFVAESVFQVVSGNVDRARAAAAALDRQEPAPDLDVVRTPRTGHHHTYRVIALAPGGRPAAWSGVEVDPLARAEPRLDAWVAHLLGDPGRFHLAGEVVDETGGVVDRPAIALDDLGRSPLSLLAMAGSGGTEQPTDLEQLVAHHLARAGPEPPGGGALHLVVDRPAGGACGLGDLLELLAAARDLVGSASALRPDDLVLPEDDQGGRVDDQELHTRAVALVAAARDAGATLRRAVERDPPDPVELTDALLAASAVGVRGAVPPAGVDPAALRDLARPLADRLEAVASRAADLLADGATGDDAVGAGPVGPAAAIRAVVGPDLPVLATFTLDEPAGLTASLSDRDRLLDGDELAPATWMHRRALVRPPVARLQRALVDAELCGTGTGVGDLAVAQLPHAPGDRWVAAALGPDGVVPHGRLAVVMHAPDGVDPAVSLAGLVVDDWGERIPSPMETTGVALHADAPASRAPQAVLVAMPADPSQRRWSVETLRDTVVEAATMARIRAIDPRHVWLAGRVLPALYVAHNVTRDTASVDVRDLQLRHAGAWGTEGPRAGGT